MVTLLRTWTHFHSSIKPKNGKTAANVITGKVFSEIILKRCNKVTTTSGANVYRFNAGQGSQCHPVGLGRHVGPSAIPRKFSAIVLGTESHGGYSKKHNCPTHKTTRYSMGLTKEFHSVHRKPPDKRPNPTADQPYEQCSHPSCRAAEPNGVKWSPHRISKPDKIAI